EVTPRDLGPRAGGLEAQVLAPMPLGRSRIAELFVREREVEVRVGEAGIGGDGALEELDRALGVPQLEREEAEVVERLGLIGIDLERSRVIRPRLLAAPATIREVTEVGDGVGERRIELERALVRGLRAIERGLVLVEAAPLEIELVGRGAIPRARLDAELLHHVVGDAIHLEVDEELPGDGLVLGAAIADDDAAALGHHAELAERTDHPRE